MTRVYTYSQPIDADIIDGFCLLQKGFTDQFVYYDKQSANRYMGLGRCIALPQMEGVEYEIEGPIDQPPVFFSFNRFDAENPKATDELFEAFPRLRFMLPEVVLVENERGRMLQVNSLSPVYPGRIARFARQAAGAPRRERVTVPFTLERDSREQWRAEVDAALSAIRSGRVGKVVLSRRQRLLAEHPFSSKDLLVNLIDGDARGTVLLYRYADGSSAAARPSCSFASAASSSRACAWRGRAPLPRILIGLASWQASLWRTRRTAPSTSTSSTSCARFWGASAMTCAFRASRRSSRCATCSTSTPR